uniref:Uncharacterized protein n=2 Tax=Meloidogyne TaxID=189290 RepID=A0A6V7VIC2_MELEN|nr:unnamed protein product [Meloidogyne enterolobii]
MITLMNVLRLILNVITVKKHLNEPMKLSARKMATVLNGDTIEKNISVNAGALLVVHLTSFKKNITRCGATIRLLGGVIARNGAKTFIIKLIKE